MSVLTIIVTSRFQAPRRSLEDLRLVLPTDFLLFRLSGDIDSRGVASPGANVTVRGRLRAGVLLSQYQALFVIVFELGEWRIVGRICWRVADLGFSVITVTIPTESLNTPVNGREQLLDVF